MTERSAGVRREDRLSAGMGTGELVRAARAGREIDSTARVYVREWCHQHRGLTEDEARSWAASKFEGRLRPEDLRVEPDDLDETWVVWARRPNVESEWKAIGYAETWAAALVEDGIAEPEDIEVVTRNSRREHVILQYGVLKLREG